jgi:hypothetical protein
MPLLSSLQETQLLSPEAGRTHFKSNFQGQSHARSPPLILDSGCMYYEHKLVLNISPGPISPEQNSFFPSTRKKRGVFTSLGEQTMGASPAHLLHTEYLRRGPSRSLANTWSLGLCVSAAQLHELP